MSNGILVSPNNAIVKTRNAILRLKKCSPELRTVLRQRCQERINNDRLKILNKLRKIKIQESFRVAFGNILCEEWKNIDDELRDPLPEACSLVLPEKFNLDEELLYEELLKKELLREHEDWLIQQYEELLNEDLENINGVVCPLCCLGFFQEKEDKNFKVTFCTKCSTSFVTEKSLPELHTAFYENLSWHERQCDSQPSFIKVPKNENENENSLCLVCHHCSYLNVII